MNIQLARRCFYAIWLCAVLSVMIVMLFKPEVFSAENIAAFLQHFRSQLWLTYFFVSFVRGFFLIPSTPFIFAGIILFPEDTFLLLFTAVAGVVFSSAMLYFYSDNLGFSQYLERYFPVQLAKVKELLKGKYAFPLVFIWSIFPFVPTDLVSYAAGLIKMPVSKVLAGIAIGELILASLYLYFGRELLQIFGAFIEYYQ